MAVHVQQSVRPGRRPAADEVHGPGVAQRARSCGQCAEVGPPVAGRLVHLDLPDRVEHQVEQLLLVRHVPVQGHRARPSSRAIRRMLIAPGPRRRRSRLRRRRSRPATARGHGAAAARPACPVQLIVPGDPLVAGPSRDAWPGRGYSCGYAEERPLLVVPARPRRSPALASGPPARATAAACLIARCLLPPPSSSRPAGPVFRPLPDLPVCCHARRCPLCA